MEVKATQLGKRYKKNWIFREVDFLFEAQKSYAITGNNGSGKSTLLKCLAGIDHFQKGTIHYASNQKAIDKNDILAHITFCAPYQDLIKEMKLNEFLAFHQKLTHPLNTENLLQTTGLQGNENKLLDEFSSGMTQRLKLGLAFFTERQLIFLDEPTSNLDLAGKQLFKQLMITNRDKKTIIIASNEKLEIDQCHQQLSIEKYKQVF
jgi:ABC-type multidrug transport system ATPase subunit